MEFRLLGPVGMQCRGGAVDMGSPKQLILFASLLLTPGQPVSAEALYDRLWGDALPDAARESLYAYVTRLRRVLKQNEDGGADPVQLRRGGGGYLLEVDPERVDLHRFRRLVDDARAAQAAGEDGRAAGLLREGLALWRGMPVAGLPGDWADRLRETLRQQQVAAMVQLASIELQRGRHMEIVDDLAGWVGEHSLAEPLVGQLMLALYRGGRGAEALTVYERTRRHLVEALGHEPAPQLQDLHRQILRQDSALAPTGVVAGQPQAAPRQSRLIAPAQLPADIPAFTGRTDALRRLDALLPGDSDQAPSTVVISAIGGAAGVGKTALAVHWAHRVAQRFPDGQLYVNLRGFDPGKAAMSPAEALRGFFDALEVPPQRIPTDTEAQAALYRSLLAGRRMLILLDNARDADQVRPLLPGTPGCLVVVTSRSQLTGLVAAGAHALPLDLLSATEARRMLTVRLGTDRIMADETAAEDIVNRCARLPLALAVVAARAATYPDFPLGALAAELSDIHNRLDTLTGDDTATDVRAAFSWSYQALSPAACRLFRLLGLHPGPDFTAVAAAALAGSPQTQARQVLGELTRAQLLKEHAPGRYTFHDLLRAYALELAMNEDTPADRRAALLRMLDHYLHSANSAGLLLSPMKERLTLKAPAPGVVIEEPAGYEGALAWFTAEHAVLLASVQAAADHGLETHAWQLAVVLRTFLQRQSYWHDWMTACRLALQAVDRAGDRLGQAQTLHGLGKACTALGLLDEAHVHLERSTGLFRELGDLEEANVHLGRGMVYARQGRYDQARHQAEESLKRYRDGGDIRGQALALNNIGWYLAKLDDHEQALIHCRKALEMLQSIGDRRGEARTWDSLGYAHHHLGDHRQAIACYRRSLEWSREFGDCEQVAETLDNLGDAHAAAAEPDLAREAWQEALDVLDDLAGHLGADVVRAKLAKLL